MTKKKGCLGCLGVFVVLVFLGVVIAAVGGDSEQTASNNTKASSSSSSAAEKPVKKEGLTYEKFISIKMGSSYDDVKAIIGKDGKQQAKNVIADIETVAYIWQDGTANMNCMFQNGVLVSKAMASLKDLVKLGGKDITLAQFEQVEPGMSYDEAKKILGRDGLLLSQGSMMGMESSIYQWINTGGSNMNLSISDGVINSKAQFGLK